MLAAISDVCGKRIISYLKGNFDDDKHLDFRHLVKRIGFRLLDFPEAGIRDALVVAEEKKQQSCRLLGIVLPHKTGMRCSCVRV